MSEELIISVCISLHCDRKINKSSSINVHNNTLPGWNLNVNFSKF